MTTPSVRRPSRTCRLIPSAISDGEYIVRITEGKKVKSYWLSEFPCDGGRGFRWETFAVDGGKAYCVFVSAHPQSEPHRCECLGHLQWGHRTVCRHVACTLALIERGLV